MVVAWRVFICISWPLTVTTGRCCGGDLDTRRCHGHPVSPEESCSHPHHMNPASSDAVFPGTQEVRGRKSRPN